MPDTWKKERSKDFDPIGCVKVATRETASCKADISRSVVLRGRRGCNDFQKSLQTGGGEENSGLVVLVGDQRKFKGQFRVLGQSQNLGEGITIGVLLPEGRRLIVETMLGFKLGRQGQKMGYDWTFAVGPCEKQRFSGRSPEPVLKELILPISP